MIRRVLILLFILLCGIIAQAQDLPTAPQPKITKTGVAEHILLTVADSTFTNMDIYRTRTDLRFPGTSEADPLWRPFIHNKIAYTVGGLETGSLAYIGIKMHQSKHWYLRDFWYAPQATDLILHIIGWNSWSVIERNHRKEGH